MTPRFVSPWSDATFAENTDPSWTRRGDSLTAMVTCVSQSPRNGDESYLTLTYGAGMARLLNAPRRQPARRLDALLREARKQHEASAAIVAKGVQGKYQARRTAEAFQWAQTVALLEEFS